MGDADGAGKAAAIERAVEVFPGADNSPAYIISIYSYNSLLVASYEKELHNLYMQDLFTDNTATQLQQRHVPSVESNRHVHDMGIMISGE